jgi:hypothetical protein
VEGRPQLKYHHSERCFTYRMMRPMVEVRSSTGGPPSRLGLHVATPHSRESPFWLGNWLVGGSRRFIPASGALNRGYLLSTIRTVQVCLVKVGLAPPPFKSLVSRHLPDGEFGWGGISVTQQRRCPKASSVGTEISRRTQA